MSFESDLRAFILADPTISVLVDTRMYPVSLPQHVAYPAISYHTISTLRGHTMQQPDFLPAQRVQIDAWSTKYAQTRQLATAIRNRIDSLRQTIGSTRVQGIFFDTERHLYEADSSSSSSSLIRLYRLSQDFICWHEDVPPPLPLPSNITNLVATAIDDRPSVFPGNISDLFAIAIDDTPLPGSIVDLMAEPIDMPGDISDLAAEAINDFESPPTSP